MQRCDSRQTMSDALNADRRAHFSTWPKAQPADLASTSRLAASPLTPRSQFQNLEHCRGDNSYVLRECPVRKPLNHLQHASRAGARPECGRTTLL